MNTLKDAIKTIIVSLVTISFVGIVYAWSEPTSNPPSGNVSTPINTGSIEQIKSGNLIINGSIKFNYHSLNSNSNGWLYLGDQNSSVYGDRGLAADYFWANTQIYTPIIYDANNTGYYIDPASSSRLGGNLSVGGSVAALNVTAAGQNVCRQNGVNCPASASIGSGTTNYISKWTSGSTLGNSIIYDNGTNVGIGTPSPAGVLEIKDSTTGARVYWMAVVDNYGADIYNSGTYKCYDTSSHNGSCASPMSSTPDAAGTSDTAEDALYYCSTTASGTYNDWYNCVSSSDTTYQGDSSLGYHCLRTVTCKKEYRMTASYVDAQQ